jgi:hypothetical protein
MTTNHPRRPPPEDEWLPAAEGEVARLTHRLKRRKTRRQFLKAGGGIVGGLLALAGGWWAVRTATHPREYDFGGITCAEVEARADDFMQGRLAPEVAAKMTQHLSLCPKCKPKFERMSGMKRLG